MRTKTLLLTAVLGVAGAASTTVQAQSVYSANAVGYVNLSLGAGFSIIANPLNNGANDLNTILTNVPNGTVVYGYSPATQGYNQSTFLSGTWHGNPTGDLVFAPGSSFFIKLASATTVTFVGNVPQGSLANTIPVGFSLQALPIPVSVSLTNSLVSLKPNSGDIVYNYVNSSQAYVQHTYLSGAFHPADYAPAVGEGFFYLNKGSAAINWSVTFSVN